VPTPGSDGGRLGPRVLDPATLAKTMLRRAETRVLTAAAGQGGRPTPQGGAMSFFRA
jgi:hypothetical protein